MHAFLTVFIESLQDIHRNRKGFLGFLKHLLTSPKDFSEFLDDLAGFHAMPMARPGPKLHFGRIPGPAEHSRPGRAFWPSILAVRDNKYLLIFGKILKSLLYKPAGDYKPKVAINCTN